MTIVTYKKDTKEVISVAPIYLIFDEGVEVDINEGDGVVKEGYDYMIFNGTEPLFKNIDGKMYLSDALIIGGDYL